MQGQITRHTMGEAKGSSGAGKRADRHGVVEPGRRERPGLEWGPAHPKSLQPMEFTVKVEEG